MLPPVIKALQEIKNQTNKNNQRRWIVITIITNLITAILFPFIFLGGVFGLAGSYPISWVLIISGYLIFAASSIIGILRSKMLWGCIIGITFALVGFQLDNNFWKKENQEFCHNARQDDFCIEREWGFQCGKPSRYGDMTTFQNICEVRLSESELALANTQKRERQIARAKAENIQPMPKIADTRNVMKAINNYEAIVKTIILSNNPQALNFEDDLVAIYNCLEAEYENPIKGEQMASGVLQRLIKTEAEKKSYMAYTASKGRILNPMRIVAGLPAGNKSLGCNSISKK